MKVLSSVVIYTEQAGKLTGREACKVLVSDMDIPEGAGGQQMLDLFVGMAILKVVTPSELTRIRAIFAEGQLCLPESMKTIKQGLY